MIEFLDHTPLPLAATPIFIARNARSSFWTIRRDADLLGYLLLRDQFLLGLLQGH